MWKNYFKKKSNICLENWKKKKNQSFQCGSFLAKTPNSRNTERSKAERVRDKMEGSCLTFSTVRSSTCLHYNSTFFKQLHTNTIKPRRGLSVKASTHNFSTAKTTLSSNWDVSNYSKAPAWMPRFEELDATNMLLRQRIVFLGSQVLTNFIKISFWGFVNSPLIDHMLISFLIASVFIR